MLCPDVWNFPVSENNITYKSGALDSKSENFIKNLISSHHFNEIASIVLPGEFQTPQTLFDLIKDSDHYLVRNIKLQDLVQKQFVEGFIKRGKFTALSCNVSSEFDDCFAVTSEGVLILSVQKDIYQCLGLEGHPILNSRTQRNKYIISINLKDPNLNTTKFFNRIKRALSHELLPDISLKFTWDPPDKTICPSSIAKYFSDCGYHVELCQTKIKVNQEYSSHFPKLCPREIKDGNLPHELVEYVAMCMLSCDAKSDFSSYELKQEVDYAGTARIIHCKGLFHTNFLINLMETLRDYHVSEKKFPWVVLYVHGYDKAPVDFFNHDHCFTGNGDNGFILFLYENNDYFLYKNVSSNKFGKK